MIASVLRRKRPRTNNLRLIPLIEMESQGRLFQEAWLCMILRARPRHQYLWAWTLDWRHPVRKRMKGERERSSGSLRASTQRTGRGPLDKEGRAGQETSSSVGPRSNPRESGRWRQLVLGHGAWKHMPHPGRPLVRPLAAMPWVEALTTQIFGSRCPRAWPTPSAPIRTRIRGWVASQPGFKIGRASCRERV